MHIHKKTANSTYPYNNYVNIGFLLTPTKSPWVHHLLRYYSAIVHFSRFPSVFRHRAPYEDGSRDLTSSQSYSPRLFSAQLADCHLSFWSGRCWVPMLACSFRSFLRAIFLNFWNCASIEAVDCIFFSPLYSRSAGTYTTMPNYYNTTGSPDSLVTQQTQLWTNAGECCFFYDFCCICLVSRWFSGKQKRF